MTPLATFPKSNKGMRNSSNEVNISVSDGSHAVEYIGRSQLRNMTIETNLRGRVNNTQLPLKRGLLPLFEAVQNSIHAIDEVDLSTGQGRIIVEIVRGGQATLVLEGDSHKPGPDSLPDITGFRIKDNGVGFTDRHMTSFETLDSDLKADIGGRGVGRLLWLKAFDGAAIESTYADDGGEKRVRNFTFTAAEGVTSDEPTKADSDSHSGTVVYLHDFDPKYRDAARKTAEAIANSLFEHCMWYFVRDGGVPTIVINDGGESINLDEVYQAHMHSSANTESILIKGHSFELTHIKLHSTIIRPHFIGWCASNRLVNEESITGKIPGLYGKLGNGNDSFIYACYVTSKYLDDRVRPERTGFVIEKSDSGGLFGQTEIAQDELTSNVLRSAGTYLEKYLETNRQAGLERVHDFVATKQPRYRPILARIPEEELTVDPEISDKELDVILHRHKYEVEKQLLSDGHEIMRPGDNETSEDYRQRMRDYLNLAEDLKKSDLAEYVTHRKVILDLLRVAIQRDKDGNYAREELIHELIMPMKEESNSVEFERSNLWLVNERLTFHDFLASDKALTSMPITDSKEKKRPDILSLNVYDESILLSEGKGLPLASIVIVEIKRPMRNDAGAGEERDPIEQTLGYLRKIRGGEMTTKSGRPIPDALDVPGFCYIICDITPSMKVRCELRGLTITSDHMGYFGYNPALKAYIEVISFDQLLTGATERNRAFFDRLGLPTN